MPEKRQSTVLLLIRHGQARAADGSYDRETPLSEIGWRQAAAVADELAARSPPRVVYTSPYPRAIETSEPACEKLGLTAVVETRLEEFELPSYSLETVAQRPDLAIWRPEHRGTSNGETLEEFSLRVAGFCDEVVERHLGERVALISHAGTIDAAIRWSMAQPAGSPWQHEFDISNASITEIEFWPHGRTEGGAPRYATVLRVGDTTHLGDLVSDL